MRDNLQIFVKSNVCAEAIELYIKHNGAWARRFEYIQVDEGTEPPIALQLHYDQAQDLMDKLWDVGLRPTEGSGRTGALAATERHLADMQRLVFDLPS